MNPEIILLKKILLIQRTADYVTRNKISEILKIINEHKNHLKSNKDVALQQAQELIEEINQLYIDTASKSYLTTYVELLQKVPSHNPYSTEQINSMSKIIDDRGDTKQYDLIKQIVQSEDIESIEDIKNALKQRILNALEQRTLNNTSGELEENNALMQRGLASIFGKSGEGLVMIAIKARDLELVKKLTELGANIDNDGVEGPRLTCLEKACQINDVGIVKYLLEKGVDPNKDTSTYWKTLGLTPLALSLCDLREEIAGRQKEIMIELIKYKIDITKTNHKGQDVTCAVFNRTVNKAQLMKTFIEEAKPNLNIKYKNGNTILMEAASRGYIEIVEVLLECKADPTTQNSAGYTAMNLAFMHNNPYLAKTIYYYYYNNIAKMISDCHHHDSDAVSKTTVIDLHQIAVIEIDLTGVANNIEKGESLVLGDAILS